MTHEQYEKALLVAAAFQLAKSDDTRELLAIMCTVRNWVISRHAAPAPYRTYSEAIANFMFAYETRALPDTTNPALVDPGEGMLAKVDVVYNNTHPDVTSSHLFPTGARYFARTTEVRAGSWFDAQVLQRQVEHPLIGVFGAQSFFV